MAGSTGLYFPWIHFRDDNWLKLSLLFWRRLRRIVPPGHAMHDSPTVEEFADWGLIRDLDPGKGAESVARRFGDLVWSNSDALRTRFAVEAYDPSELFYLHTSKVIKKLRESLLQLGLATQSRGMDRGWIGIHPDVGRVYMTALAADLANDLGASLVSEKPEDLVAGSGWSVEDLSTALLGTRRPDQLSGGDHRTALAFTALKTVVPTNLEAVPGATILEIRDSYGDELTDFRDSIQKVSEAAALDAVHDPEELRIRIDEAYEDYVAPKVKGLRRDLRGLKLDTGWGWIGVKTSLPSLTGIAVNASPPVQGAVTGSTILLGLAEVRGSARRRARAVLDGNPAAYLMRLDEELNPRPLKRSIERSLRRFMLGI